MNLGRSVLIPPDYPDKPLHGNKIQGQFCLWARLNPSKMALIDHLSLSLQSQMQGFPNFSQSSQYQLAPGGQLHLSIFSPQLSVSASSHPSAFSFFHSFSLQFKFQPTWCGSPFNLHTAVQSGVDPCSVYHHLLHQTQVILCNAYAQIIIIAARQSLLH